MSPAPYSDEGEHFHIWRPRVWGPCEGAIGRYARCTCGAQCFVGARDDEPVAIYFAPDRSYRKEVAVEALI